MFSFIKFSLKHSIICDITLKNTLSYLTNETNLTNINGIISQQQKLLKVAIIGAPNAGKSTLINNLMDRKVCPVSKKVHTTRKRSHAIITQNKTQIVFLDNPGLVSKSELKKYNLEKSFENDTSKSLREADLIGVVHDISNTWTREHLNVKLINLLHDFKHKSSFLVLNKIDTLKSKRKLLDITRIITHNSKVSFNEIFMVSALTGNGTQDIKNYLINNAKVSQWLYPEDTFTENTFDDIIVRTVQATLLDFLPQEIPYKLKTQMELFEISDNGKIHAVVLVECPLERIQKLVTGVGDGKLRQITEKAQKDLLHTFDQPVRLQLVVNVRKK